MKGENKPGQGKSFTCTAEETGNVQVYTLEGFTFLKILCFSLSLNCEAQNLPEQHQASAHISSSERKERASHCAHSMVKGCDRENPISLEASQGKSCFCIYL